MENIKDLSRQELLGLKEVRSTGRAANSALGNQLIRDNLVGVTSAGELVLTLKGRRLLLRGSPALWDIAS